MRIVSLIASATEIVCALGARSDLVGRSHECDWPADVEALPPLTSPRFDTGLSSQEIDSAVKDIVREGLSVYDVDRDLLKELAPDVIVTQDQCEVCAANLSDVENALCDWVGQDIQIISLQPETLTDVIDDVCTVAKAIGRGSEAEDLKTSLNERLNNLADIIPAEAKRPSVFILEWIDPPMAAGHWIPKLVEAAGGRNLITKEGDPSSYVSWEDIAKADPDLIIVAPCGFDLNRTVNEMAPLANVPAWQNLRAVQDGKVAVMDGNRFINRPSPAVIESAEIVSDILWNKTPRHAAEATASTWHWHSSSRA